MKRLPALISMLASVFLVVGAQRAQAYGFQVCSIGFASKYIHVRTVSALCHDRTPVDTGDPILSQGCVSGDTALGCLIDRVDFITTDGTIYTWSSWAGVTGGRFSLIQTNPNGSPYVCFADWDPSC